jgi:hypothetical protein
MSSAPEPATRMRALALIGSTPSFLSSTRDLRTASRASARCSGEPITPALPSNGRSGSNSPSLTFTRRMRRTASSMRPIGISPERACARVVS